MNINWKKVVASLSLLILSVMLSPLADAATKTIKSGLKFNHAKTGFELKGAHVKAKCESCHVNGILKGTPKKCEGCHVNGNQMNAIAKPANHVSSQDNCDACHVP
ncbi:MAG TPA: hypothetical protein DCG63_01125, partial [Methylophilaceae bacterium]|nr:hypothetical protein [Methylophilaceae bacterium]